MARRERLEQLAPWLARLASVRFELAAIGLGAIAIYLVQLLQFEGTGTADRVTLALVFWGALIYLVWQRQGQLRLESDTVSTLLGLLLLGLLLVKSVTLFWFESAFLRVAPLLVGLSVGLLASGWRGLAQYWREGIVILLLCLPSEYFVKPLFTQVIDATQVIAGVAAFGLWYLGFDVELQGNIVSLPWGSVQVIYPCTGADAAWMLLKLAVVFVLVVSLSWKQRALALLAAPAIGFGSGLIRVAILVNLVDDQATFDYWHGGAGDAIFSTAAMLAFGILCQAIVSRNEKLSDA